MMTFRDAAVAVLTEHGQPMTVTELWDAMSSRGLVESSGDTPVNTLRTVLLRSAVGSSISKGTAEKVFARVGPATFGLASWPTAPGPATTSPAPPAAAARPSVSAWRTSKAALRASSDGARALFEWIAPDDEDRHALARLVLRVVRAADLATHGEGWSLTMRRRSIVVNTGLLTVLTVGRNECALLAEPAQLAALEVVRSGGGPVQLPAFKWCELPTDVFIDTPDVWWPALAAAIAAAALTGTAAYARWHSPGMIAHLRDYLEEDVPAPAFQARAPSQGEEADDSDDDETGYWKLSPERGAELWPAWKAGGYASIGWGERLGDIVGLTDEEFGLRLAAAQERDPDLGEGPWQALRFSRLRVGDILFANRGISEVLGIGRVTGPCVYDPAGGDHAYRVPVDWYDTRSRIVDMRGWRSTLIRVKPEDAEAIIGQVTPLPVVELPPVGVAADLTAVRSWFQRPPTLTLEDAARETGFASGELAAWQRIWITKQHLVLQGPPGTGKTYVAQRLARLLAGADGLVELVQFHPAYTYEDFIQGLRPQIVDGQLRYHMEPGRFLSFCDRAARVTGPAVLIIDEINRANVPRVFGELMYLLEYRDHTAPLASGGELRVPRNVYLLGTMNTADRSIARMDHALRRRFSFVRLEPRLDVLATRLAERNAPAPAALIEVLTQLNATIDDPNFSLGISFFLRDDIATTLPDVWRCEVEPHLEEYFYDAPEKIEPFRWSALAAGLLAGWT